MGAYCVVFFLPRQSSGRLPDLEASAQYRSSTQAFTLLDGDLRCCSWNLPEPLSQFQGHSSQCSYYHWNLHSLYLLQLFFQPHGIFLKLLVFRLPDAAVPWDCCIYHHSRSVSYHQGVDLVLAWSFSTTCSPYCIYNLLVCAGLSRGYLCTACMVWWTLATIDLVLTACSCAARKR